MTKDIDDLLPETMRYCPSCPEPTAFWAIRDAARELCERGRMWSEADQFQVSSPESEGLCTIPDSDVVAIAQAEMGGASLEPQSVGWLDRNVPLWQTYTDDSAPARYVTQLNPNTITVVPKATGMLSLRLILKPSRTAVTVPDFLVDQYGAEIGRGAAGRILTLPRGEYANPQLGAALLGEFKACLDRVAIKTAKGVQGARLRVKPNFM